MRDHIYIFCDNKGYTQIHDVEKTGTFRLHQLTAIAEGADPYEIFGGEKVVHHMNGWNYDERPSNLTTVTRQEHREIHAAGDSGDKATV